MNDTETIMFRLALKTALENNFKDPEFRDSPAKGLKQFDRIVNLGRTPAFAFEIMHNCIASETETAAAIQSVKQVIQEQLDALNKTHKGIDRNPLTRLRELIKRHNEKAKAGADGVLVNGQPLTDKEKAMALTKVPGFLKTESYTAIASDRSGKQRGKMDIDVTYHNGR